MSRIAIFASYDKEGIIHDYVLGYLRYLKKVADKIIFIADNHADKKEQNKLKNIVDYAEFCPHGEYDFGSYKRGFAWLKKQKYYKDVSEIILCNDSCFTVGNFQAIFSKMDKKYYDFWGMTYNKCGSHIQSYFWVLKKSVFDSKTFDNFIFSVKKEEKFLDIVLNYELPFTKLLEDNGYSVSAYIPPMYLPHQHPLITLKKGNPLVKRKCFVTPKYDLRDICLDNPFRLLRLIKKISRIDYSFIQEYHTELLFWICIKIIVARNFFTFINKIKKIQSFLYKKKRTKSGIIIKICKIPIFYKKEKKND